MNIGVIGAGRWGKKILKTLTSDPSTIPHIAYGGSVETERFLRAEYPQSTLTKDYRELLKNNELEAVIIATPIPTHAEIVRDALTANKHVFAEKPLSLSNTEVEELYTLANEKKLTLFTGYLYLYDPAFEALKTKLQTATNLHLDLCWEKHGTFDTSLHENLLVHELAILHELIGGVTLNTIAKNEPDVFDATFKSARGTAHIHIDRTKTKKEKKLIIKTESATYEHAFNNENLLSLELNAFFDATKTGSATNKKRQHIDESIAAVLADLPRVS